jgi:protein-L-isoaspartate(D-aspartate) O-methyltransferase
MTPIDYAKVRETMVEQQVRPWDVLDVRVLDVLSRIPREAFVPAAYRALAYADLPVPIGHGQYMLKPVVEGRMLQALALAGADDVLEIGTGSGFISACLGQLSREVLSIEIDAVLADAARGRLAELGLDHNVRIEVADALRYTPGRQFDAICVGAAVDRIPDTFLQWLRPGGRLFVVRGRSPAMAAELVRNTGTVFTTESLFENELPNLAGAQPVAEFQV